MLVEALSVFAQDNPIKFSAGAGVSFLANTNDQQASGIELKDATTSFGFNGFVDMTQYFTINAGYRIAVGQDTRSASSGLLSGKANINNTIGQFELGAELKYPFNINRRFSIAPKVGIDALFYSSGDIVDSAGNSTTGSDDGKKQYSPIFLTFGADLNIYVSRDVFLRIPLDFDVGLNSQLSSAYYFPDSYTSSYDTAFRIGFEVGRDF
jgi:hypothetical protein